ncbi:putative NTPase (NACHT family) [Mycobacterium tuberculosis]|nr:putative NTPase (NACHT family) [Mycobacterium tuberculosis]
MHVLKFMGRSLIAASLLVAAGVAVNQILNNGKLSWNWGYLALVFTVLGGLVEAAPQAAPPASENAPPTLRGRGSRREYFRRMRSAVGQMETIGLVTQAEFVLRARQVYVDVMLRPRTVTAVVTDTGIGPVSSPAVGRRASLGSFLTGGRVLAVLGAAGSGKTTLARHTALEMAERRWHSAWRRRRLPVLLYLRDHAEQITSEHPDGLARIAVTAPWLNGVISAEWLEKRLARGRCVVLLDGLDEVADAQDRSRVVQWVEDAIDGHPDNAFVVTSRPLGYDGNRLSRADVLQVQRFTGGQIRAFLHAWYRAIERRSRHGDTRETDRIAAQAADDLLHRITGRPTLYDLAANPLLLTMIANVHRYRGSLPGSRAALYEEVCQVLLHRRQEAKNLTDPGMDGLSGEKKERIAQELAWYMMRRSLRDIPVEEAERAIRAVLQRTAPDVTPEGFLTYVKRSGLLLEHQYRRYGFAHLTLQEYLAAALVPGHASRRQLLVDSVSDPWWRETTLLWAARADASPVVEACLAIRTITALNLAYACANEARELDPALRDRLDELLTNPSGTADEVRLLDGVAAARVLQDTHTLEDGARICANPVTSDLWYRHALARGATPSRLNYGPWTNGIKDFLTWLNSLFDDGTGYRLPSPDEAREALSGDLYPAAGTILCAADREWPDDRGQTRLITAASAPHPHRPTEQQVDIYPGLILQETRLVLRLLRPASELTFLQLVAFAAPRDLAAPEGRLLHALDLTLDLMFSREHTRALTRDRALEYAHDLGLELGASFAAGPEPDEPIDHRDLGLDLSRIHGLAGHLGLRLHREARLGLDLPSDLVEVREHDLGEALINLLSRQSPADGPAGVLAQSLALARDFDLDNDRALNLDRDLVRDLAIELDIDLLDSLDLVHTPPFQNLLSARRRSDHTDHTVRIASAIKPGLERVLRDAGLRAVTSRGRFDSRVFQRSLDRVTNLESLRNLDVALATVLGNARTLDGLLASEHALEAEAAHNLTQVLTRGRTRTLALARARERAHARANDINRTLDRDFAYDLACDLALARLIPVSDLGSRGVDALVRIGAASAIMVDRIAPPAARRRWSSAGRRRIRGEATLAQTLRDELDGTLAAPPADDPAIALKTARNIARARDIRDVEVLIENALELSAPLWDGSRSVKQSDMVLAAVSVLAASLASMERRGEEPDELLNGALAALIALTPDTAAETEGVPPARHLVLVRN